jgi:hypothetical protein
VSLIAWNEHDVTSGCVTFRPPGNGRCAKVRHFACAVSTEARRPFPKDEILNAIEEAGFTGFIAETK